jgi:hypothetical protein
LAPFALHLAQQYSAARRLPTFFRANIIEARQGRHGYFNAGFHLAIHARSLVEGDVPDHVVDEFDRALDAPDREEQMWRWLRRTLPRCMALVPTRRKRTFLRGVAQAFEEDRV